MDHELTTWRENILPKDVLGHDLGKGTAKNYVTNILGSSVPAIARRQRSGRASWP